MARIKDPERTRAGKKRRGYVRLYRALLDSPIFAYKKEGLLKLFIYCILRASHKPRMFGGIALESGQFIFGAKAASTKLCINECTLRRRMKQLKLLGVVTHKVTDLGTIITVCNWETYQTANLKSDAESDANNDAKEQKSDVKSDAESDYIQECSSKKNVDNKKTPTESKSGTAKNAVCSIDSLELPAVLDSAEARQTIADWLAYKSERREAYKPVGLKAFITRTATLTKLHGWTLVGAAFEKAMASGWKGYEQDGTFPAVPAQPVSRYVHPDSEEAKEWTPW